jgi:DNA-binding SARP family transcriptional activator
MTLAITRTRLIKQIQKALNDGNVVIAAPAGFGKTTLLQQLAAQRIDTHLFTLTVADTDVAALRARLVPFIRPGYTLILDDIHHLAGSVALTWLQEEMEMQADVCFVLAGREIPFAADWLQDPLTVTVFRQTQLAFDLGESVALLPANAQTAVTRWHQQLQGWPLGIGLLARLPAGEEGLPEVKEQLFAYLARRVFAQLPDGLRHFLQVTAVPLTFNDQLASHLLDDDNAAGLRQMAQQRNLFLYQDERPGWFRYHGLIRDYLLTQQDELDGYWQKTIAWFEAQDDLPQAIEHALAAGWQGEAARLISLVSPTYIYDNDRYLTYRRWVEALDEQIRARQPHLLFRLGHFINFLEKHKALARAYVTQALAAAEAVGDRRMALLSRWQLAVFTQEESGASEALLAELAELAAEPEVAMYASRTFAHALTDDGRFFPAVAAWQRVVMLAEAEGLPEQAWAARRTLALTALLPLGRFAVAAALFDGALRHFADEPGWRYETLQNSCERHFACADWPALAVALVEIETLAQAVESAPVHNLIWTSYYRGLLAIALGDFAAAGEHLAALSAQTSAGDRRSEIPLARAVCWGLRRQGELTAVLARATAELAQPPSFPHYRALLALEHDLAAGALFLDGSRPDFVPLPETLALIGMRARPDLVRLRALLALVCHRQGDGRWRRHFHAALYALTLPHHERLLTDRDPELGGRFWQLAVMEGLALGQAGAALQQLNRPDLLYPLLTHQETAVRQRAARILGQMGQEAAMPPLTQAIGKEKDKATKQVLTAVLTHLETSPPPPLQIQLLGDFRLVRDGRPVPDSDWPRPVTRRLAQYFALYRGVALPRDQILDDLWPDLPPAKAWANFRTVYSQLRRVVEPYMRPKVESRYFSLERDRYLFDPGDYVTVDVAAFETAVRHTLATAADHSLPPLPADLLTQLENWQPLLPELAYEEWLLAARERLETTYIEGCLYVARGQLSYGRPAEAVVWARWAVAKAPWLEEGYRALMRAYARQDQRSLALKTYEEAVRALQDELNVTPSAMTQWLYTRLQNGEAI